MRPRFLAADNRLLSLGWALFLVVLVLIHLYAVYIAYASGDMGAAVLTLFLPVVSNLFWLYIVATEAGWAHPYALLFMLLFAIVSALGVALAMSRRNEERELHDVLSGEGFHREFSASTSRTRRKDARSDENRAVVPCVQCGTSLRLPRGRTGTVRCPNCQNQGFYST